MGTKIIDAVRKLLGSELDGSEQLPIGVTGETQSVSISVAQLVSYITDNILTDRIVSPDTLGVMIANDDVGGGAFISVELDGVEICKITETSIVPSADNTLDIGSTTKTIKDVYMSGALTAGTGALSKGDIYYVDASGNLERLGIGADGTILTANGGVPSWGSATYDFVPSYFIVGGTTIADATSATAFTSFKSLLDTIATTSTGANIYMNGFFRMTSNVSVTMDNIRLFGNNAYIVCNSTLNDISNANTYTITISSGSPTFNNIQFYGSSGGTSQNFSTFNTRQIFTVTNTDPNGEDLTFVNCNFIDIVGGINPTVTPAISFTGIPANATTRLTFQGCSIASHDSTGAFTYNGFGIGLTGTIAGTLQVNVVNQIYASINDSATYGLNSLNYTIFSASTFGAGATFDSDFTSQLVNTTGVTRTNVGDKLLPITATTLATTDRLVITDVSSNNVKYIEIAELQKSVSSAASVAVTEKSLIDNTAIASLGNETALIAAPGVQRAIQLVSVIYNLDYDTSGITLASEDLEVYYAGHATPILTIYNADVTASSSVISQIILADKFTIYQNTALVCKTSGGTHPTISDNSRIRFFITYNIIELS